MSFGSILGVVCLSIYRWCDVLMVGIVAVVAVVADVAVNVVRNGQVRAYCIRQEASLENKSRINSSASYDIK